MLLVNVLAPDKFVLVTSSFGVPQKRQFWFENLFLLNWGFRFRVWFVWPITSEDVELLVESFLAFWFLVSCLRIFGCICQVLWFPVPIVFSVGRL